MWLRDGLTMLAVVCLAAGCGGTSGPERPSERPPSVAKSPSLQHEGCNIVFVSFDALQAARVGALRGGRSITPTWDTMAERGFHFTSAISVSSWTVPASMTWFTGVYPSEHRMTNKFAVYNANEQKIATLKDLAPELATLAAVLREQGYTTAGFTGNAGVSGGFGYEQGFDVYVHEQGKFGSFDESIPKALTWLSANRGRKFFLFLHGYDIHGQNSPGDGFDYRFVNPAYDRRYTGSPQEQEVLREEGLDKGQLTLRDEDVEFWRAVYDEKIQRADAKFAHFLAEFDKLGLTDKTLFVLTSDHGTEVYEHRRFDHGFTLYSEQIHVPLVIRVPGQTTGRVIADRISSIDLMPTILDLAGVRPAESVSRQLRGKSLLDAMQGDPVERDVFSETDYRLYTYKRSIISPDGWKLIYTLESRTRELYDLAHDATETHNLADSDPSRADALEQRLFDHFRSIGHDLRSRRWDPGYNPVYAFPQRN